MCGRPVFSNKSPYCLRCSHFNRRMKDSGIHGKAAKRIRAYVRRYGFICFYTKMPLNLTDPRSRWYCVFDHWKPGDGRKVVITSSLFNEMKSDLSENELWYYVLQLYNYKKNHIKIKQKKHFIYWDRIVPPSLPKTSKKIFRKCCICSQAVYRPNARYCLRCSEFGFRMKNKLLPRQTVQAIWDYIRKYGYVCYYTKVPLDLENHQSPWYCVFNHRVPRDKSTVVITCYLFNEMKSDLTDREFWYYIGQLARYRLTGTKIRKRM